MKKASESIPKYVKLKGVALRKSGKKYYRDAGRWFVEYREIGGKLFSWYPNKGMPELHRRELVPTTEKEYVEQNEGYLPKHLRDK